MSQINSGDGMEPRPCRKCGGKPIVIPPDDLFSGYSVFCDKEPFEHKTANGKTEQDAILKWNKLQEGQE